MPNQLDAVLQRIRAHAFGQLPHDARTVTNLHIDERIIPPGETIGPARQKITAPKPSVLVFADDQPMTDYSHRCRYLFYDATSGDLVREAPAQFPPYSAPKPTFKLFHEPVKLAALRFPVGLKPYHRCPILIPDGQRYAILYSGMSNVRHLNNLEFLYRTLIDHYSFKSANIYVLNYDGTLRSQDGVPPPYVGDGTAYRMHITGPGTRGGLESAIDDVKGRLKSHDTLFLYTGNHGGWDNTPGSADLCTYPSWDGYHAVDLASKISQLPKFRSLLVMMSQCHSGGFNTPIVNASPATSTSVAASVIEAESSSVTYDFNIFAREWTSAQSGHDPYNHGLPANPDSNGNGAIEAQEAFDYAYARRPAGNDPLFTKNATGGAIALGQAYTRVSWWCPIIFRAVEKHFPPIPPEEYYARIQAAQPELTRIANELEVQTNKLEHEYAAKVDKAVADVAKKAIARPA